MRLGNSLVHFLLAGLANLTGTTAVASEKMPSLIPPIPIGCLIRPECKPHFERTAIFHATTSIDNLEKLVSGGSMLAISPSLHLVDLVPNKNFLINDGVVEYVDGIIQNNIELARQRSALPINDQITPSQKKALTAGRRELSEQPQIVKDQFEKYRVSEEYFRCSASERALDFIRQSEGANGSSISKLVIAYTRYVDACFIGNGSSINTALERYAVLATDWPPKSPIGVFCAGFLLDKQTLVTAKHCITGDQVIGKRRIPLKLFPGTYAIFPFISNEKLPVELRGPGAFFNPAQPDRDVVLINVAASTATVKGRFAVRDPKDWDQLNFVGNFLSLSRLEAAKDEDGFRRLTEKTIKFDSAPTCRVFKVKGRCIYHACQTIGGYSGSPLLAVADGNAYLVGVHTGAANVESPACGFQRVRFFPNYGVMLDLSERVK